MYKQITSVEIKRMAASRSTATSTTITGADSVDVLAIVLHWQAEGLYLGRFIRYRTYSSLFLLFFYETGGGLPTGYILKK